MMMSAVAKSVEAIEPPFVHERRRQPRLVAECNALIRLSTALTFRCQVRNISMDAVQVSCDARYALLVHPRGGQLDPQDQRLLELSVAVPLGGSVRGFTTRCRTRYCERAADMSSMMLGLEFFDLDSSAAQLLASFIGTLSDA
jgi:PilZ domain